MNTTATEVETNFITVKECVFPYQLNKTLLPSDILPRIYDDLVAEDLLRELLHEQRMEKAAFVDFLESIPLSIFVDLQENRYVGLAWMADMSETETHHRAFGAYCFFKRYWDMKTSLLYGRICVAQWFNPQLFGLPFRGIDLLLGMTPKPNRLSRIWSTRLGLKYVAVLPGFTSYHGKPADGMICQVTREDFNKKWGI